MYHHFHGELTHLEAGNAVIDCNGVGYLLSVSMQTAGKISGRVNQKVLLYSYLQVREDAMELYGFADKEELRAFKLLISVSGVGPKAALAILSVLTVEQFARAVASSDSKMLSQAPGVGGKTAARIVLELKDKIGMELSASSNGEVIVPTVQENANTLEALNALLVLGFSRPQASQVLREIDPALPLEEMIAQALKRLNRI